MKFSLCGGYVEWKGPLSNLTHTECAGCGEKNSQIPEYDEPEEQTMTSPTKRPPGRPKLDESLHCSHRIYAGLTKEEHEAATKLARLLDTPRPDFVRDAVIKHIESFSVGKSCPKCGGKLYGVRAFGGDPKPYCYQCLKFHY